MQIRKFIIKHATNCIADVAKKKRVLQKPIKGKCAKPKDLWKTLKSFGLSKKNSVVETNAIENNKRLIYNLKSVAQTFAKFYSNLAESLLKNLPNSPNKFDMNFVHQYYKNIELKDNFDLKLNTEKVSGFKSFAIY